MEPEDIVVVPAETTPTVEPVVETAPQPSAEDLEIYSLGLAAKQGWAPVQPVVDNTPKAPTYPGTSTPLPSNFEDLDPMVQQAMHEMAIANEQNLQTQLANQRMQTTQEMAPILRQAAIAQIASSHKGIDNDDAAEIAKMIETATKRPITGQLDAESAKLFGLAAKGLAASRPAKAVGDHAPSSAAPVKDSSELNEALANYRAMYGKEPSEFIKKELEASLS